MYAYFQLYTLHKLYARCITTLKAEKHGLIEKPLTGAVFDSVARCTVHPATNMVHVCVQGFGGFMQLLCACLDSCAHIKAFLAFLRPHQRKLSKQGRASFLALATSGRTTLGSDVHVDVVSSNPEQPVRSLAADG